MILGHVIRVDLWKMETLGNLQRPKEHDADVMKVNHMWPNLAYDFSDRVGRGQSLIEAKDLDRCDSIHANSLPRLERRLAETSCRYYRNLVIKFHEMRAYRLKMYPDAGGGRQEIIRYHANGQLRLIVHKKWFHAIAGVFKVPGW